MAKLTGVKNLTGGRQKLQKTIVTIELSAFDLCRIQSFIKIEAFAVLRPKLWPKRSQLPTLTCAKNHRKLVVNEFNIFKLFTMQNSLENG